MQQNTERMLTLIAEQANLSEGSEGVRLILLTMFRFPSLKNKKVSQKTGIAIPALAAVRGELVKAGIIEKKNFLGDQGRTWIRENLNFKYEYDPVPNYNTLDLTLPVDLNLSGIKSVNEILNERPDADFSLDQSHATSDTVISRMLYLLKKGELEGRKILFLGDDDATSLLIGLLDLVEEITVIDIDSHIIDFLSRKAYDLSIKNYKLVSHDLRDPLPSNLINKYDLVITDPPYTNEGLRLFLKRAQQALRTKILIDKIQHYVIGKKCLLSFGNKPPKELLQIQLSILDHGFTINEMIPYFNLYKGASILGQFSHLYYLQLTQQVSSISHNFGQRLTPIYTSEVKSRKVLPFRPLGYHFIGELRFNNQDLLFDNTRIEDIFYNSLESAKLKIIELFHHPYKPHGYTSVAILQTSHAALHTWPEHGYISIDIFICDEFEKGIEVIKFLKEEFNPTFSEFFYMERGKDSDFKYKPLLP
jgi:S-adenosylmethionine decarboxylase proenzyme